MSSISLTKFGENVPVTSIVAISQAAVGFGVGLLLADKLGRTARQRTALALIGAGAATILPFVAGIISKTSPVSNRSMERRLASIRRDTGLSNGEEAY